MHNATVDATTPVQTILNSIQIELGSTATVYEPFTPNSPSPDYPAPITGKSAVSVTRNGKNQFNISNVRNLSISPSVYTLGTDAASRTVYVVCAPNTTYTLSKILSARFRIAWTEVVPVTGVPVYGHTNRDGYTNGTITTGPTAKYIVAYVWNSSLDATIAASDLLASIQVELGPTATAFEPYGGDTYPVTLPEELYGLPGAEDEARSDGTITKRTKIVEIKSTDTFTTVVAYGNTIRFDWVNAQSDGAWSASDSTIYGICSHLKNGASNSDSTDTPHFRTSSANSNLVFYLPKSVLATHDIAGIKAWLDSKKAAGRPLQALYKLATPQTLTINPVTIPALPGVNHIFTDGGGETTAAGRGGAEYFDARLAAVEQYIAGL